MAWKSQRTRALDLAEAQSERTQLEVDMLRRELAGVHGELGNLQRELARRDVELIGAVAHVTTVTDQLRLQNEQDIAHHDRLDRAIELLTTLIASSVPAAATETETVELGETSAPTVIGGSVDPSLLATRAAAGAPGEPSIDLTTDARSVPESRNRGETASLASPTVTAPKKPADWGR